VMLLYSIIFVASKLSKETKNHIVLWAAMCLYVEIEKEMANYGDFLQISLLARVTYLT
jgi:hypothetical protein